MITSAKKARKLMKAHPEMFAGLTRTYQFKVWLRDNLHVYKSFEYYALELRRLGKRRHYGAKAIVERMRWDDWISSDTSEYKMPNEMTSYLARLAMAGSVELRGMFNIKDGSSFK